MCRVKITVDVFALLGCCADLIVVPDVSGQPTGTMFKGQLSSSTRPLTMGRPETSLTNNQPSLRNISEER